MNKPNLPAGPEGYALELEELRAKQEPWLAGREIINADDEKDAKILFDKAHDLGKRAEADRRARKIVFENHGKEVDKVFKPLTEGADAIKQRLRGAIDKYLARLERERAEIARAAREAAELAAKEAAAAENPFDKFDAGRAAETQAQVAAELTQVAETRPSLSGVGGSRAMSLRTYYDVEVVDAAALVECFKESPTMIECARVLARDIVRNQKGDATGVAGIRVLTDRRAV